ncbi:MAG: 2-dehydropantoate 2-reductase [Desulfitobacteriaceae bacterium]
MNVGVIGVGGVGGYFGGKLAKLLDQNANIDLKIYFIARNEHLEEIKKNGLILSTVDEGEIICRPTLVTDKFDELPGLDLCLICIKSYDLNNVLKSIKSKIKDTTDIIPLLNGVDIHERIRAVIPNGIVYPSCVYVGTHIERYGKVVQNGGSCTILFGKDPQYPSVVPQRVFDLLNAGNIKYKWHDDPYQEIWSKYIFISAYGMITTSENKTLGQILESKEQSDMVISIMNEIVEITKKQGINLPVNIIKESFEKGKNFPYETKTSFQRDIEHKDRLNERDLFGDTIIRLGESLGVETPTTKLINDKIKLYKQNGSLGSVAEDLFVELFCDTFGPDKSEYLFLQYPFTDIYGNRRSIDFALESEYIKIAIEIDGETYHNPNKVSSNKYYDDLTKQNSLIYQNWKVYRWVYYQLKQHPEKVKDELRIFVGEIPTFKMLEDYLPRQKGKLIELREHQQAALANLQTMRDQGESIALLYHATGTGKTVTAVSDAKRLGKRTLFLAHTKELITQAQDTFNDIWGKADAGLYVAEQKDKDAYVVCSSIQSISRNLEEFKPDDFGYVIIDECHHGAADTYRKVLSYFKPEFTLGLTATPDRADGESILEDFKNIAHKLDLKEAVELGELVPIRCIRVKTNVDLSMVRINGIK